ncbi:MAG: 23S rRNA (adenine(2030)-N(6))-methyltransferase RlmJ [Rhodospirillaceae bacterium]|nr:MAG: 23S rRNA (adenine(2030)-N(6))-methyltransferase RlmJ [Rhodospirillaceae bacterium]
MLSYQHAYHAGGPADVHKHVALSALALRLAQKDKPFCAIDVFAGEGIYDLSDPAAAKTGEFQRGIAALWDQGENAPPAIAAYLAHVRQLNADGHLRRYPGSPAVLKAALRPGDQLTVNELHPAAGKALRRWARGDARVAIHHRDGLEALVALVPPSPRRGLVVIDPSYERASDYANTATALARASAKWAEGIFVVWYPLLADQRHLPLLTAIDKDIALPTLASELNFNLPGLPDAPTLGLRGSGLLVINPPWHWDHVMTQAGDWLAATLRLGPGASHTLRWIHPPK